MRGVPSSPAFATMHPLTVCAICSQPGNDTTSTCTASKGRSADASSIVAAYRPCPPMRGRARRRSSRCRPGPPAGPRPVASGGTAPPRTPPCPAGPLESSLPVQRQLRAKKFVHGRNTKRLRTRENVGAADEPAQRSSAGFRLDVQIAAALPVPRLDLEWPCQQHESAHPEQRRH